MINIQKSYLVHIGSIQPILSSSVLFGPIQSFCPLKFYSIHFGPFNQINTQTPLAPIQLLFHLHDSGLDQAFIDALPMFYYKDMIGLKEPSDCAVFLCEFSDLDKLRLLPTCSHAFHTACMKSTPSLQRDSIGLWQS